MAWLQKRNGVYYICHWEGKKKIKKSLKHGDEVKAGDAPGYFIAMPY